MADGFTVPHQGLPAEKKILKFNLNYKNYESVNQKRH